MVRGRAELAQLRIGKGSGEVAIGDAETDVREPDLEIVMPELEAYRPGCKGFTDEPLLIVELDDAG